MAISIKPLEDRIVVKANEGRAKDCIWFSNFQTPLKKSHKREL